MITVIKAIQKKIDLINETLDWFTDIVVGEECLEQSESKFITELTKSIETLSAYHNDYNSLYILLQSFYFTSTRGGNVFFTELENKWLDILVLWFELEEELPKLDSMNMDMEHANIDEKYFEDLQIKVSSFESILINDTKGLNRFSQNYLDNQEKNLLSFADYKYLFAVQKEYHHKNQDLEQFEEYGIDVLEESIKKRISRDDITIQEYTLELEKKRDNLSSYKSFKGYRSDFITENKDIIISKPFRFNFVTTGYCTNSRASQKDYYIEHVHNYLKNHPEDFGLQIQKEVFEHIVNYKKLPHGSYKIAWNGKATDAVVFCRLFEIELSRFNRCFKLSNAKLLRSNAATKNPKTDFAVFVNGLKTEFDSSI